MFVIFLLLAIRVQCTEIYNEDLFLIPLDSGDTNFIFEFAMSKPIVNSVSKRSYRLFPLSLGQVIESHKIQELHLSLTQGFWLNSLWGYSKRDASPGAEIWMWFSPEVSDVETSWAYSTNALAGLLCSSMNQVAENKSVSPKVTFLPNGYLDPLTRSSSFKYGALPGEPVCTENLTPFKKLLPCSTHNGLIRLLEASKVFNSKFTSLGIDFIQECMDKECNQRVWHLKLSLSMVVNTLRKKLHFSSLFNSMIIRHCPLTTNANLHFKRNANLDIYLNSSYKWTKENEWMTASLQNLPSNGPEYSYPSNFKFKMPSALPVYFHRYLSGSLGEDESFIVCDIFNNLESYQEVFYLENIPWFVRILSYTLSTKSNGKSVQRTFYHYLSAKDRNRPSIMEIGMILPPKSKTVVSFKVIRGLIKWTEHPPDPHHGHYIPSAVLSFTLNSSSHKVMQRHSLRSEILIAQLMVPDFSMPYNVICLSSTIFSVGYGAIQTITTRRFSLKETKTLKENIFSFIMKFFRRS